MAVRIEQPSPFAPGISANYGAAEAMMRGTPVIADVSSDVARTRIAAANARADRAARGSASGSAAMALAQRQTEADYANLQRAALGQAEYDTRQADRDLARDQLGAQVMRDTRAFEQQHNEPVARAAVQQMLAGYQLTFEENLRLDRMKSAMSHIANDRTLDEETKARMMSKIQTDIDPMEMRAQSAQARALEQKAAQMDQEATIRTQVLNKASELEKEMKAKGVGVLNLGINPDTLMPRLLFQNQKDGTWYEPFDSRGGSSGKDSQPADKYGRTPADFQKALLAVQKDMDKWRQDRMKRPVGAPDSWSPPADLTSQEYAANVAEEMKKLGFAPTLEQHFGGQQQQQPQPVSGPAPAQQQQQPENRPFDRSKPGTWSPYQQQKMGEFAQLNADAQKLPEADRQVASKAVNKLEAILSSYGHPQQITDEKDRREYYAAVDEVVKRFQNRKVNAPRRLQPGAMVR